VVFAGVMAVLAGGTVGRAQPPQAALKFDVASVKPAGPFDPQTTGRRRGGPGTADPTRVTFTRVNLGSLLRLAYSVDPDQVSGPDWLNDFNDPYVYTVTATMPAGTSQEQLNLMLQNLLAERFHLTLHHISKEVPGYELQVAEGGPKIHEYVPPAEGAAAGDVPAGPDKDGFPRLRGTAPGVAFRMPAGSGWAMERARYRVPMSQFARSLGSAINESTGIAGGSAVPQVADKTGLSGIYEFTLEYAALLVRPGAEPVSTPGIASDPGDIGPTIFVAVEKQLGLKLVKLKSVPIDVLVIDHADRVPTED